MAQYLKAKEFFEEIVISKTEDKLTKRAEDMLILLGYKAIKKLKYFNPDDRDDCLQTGLMVMFMNWRNFDPQKSTNAFAYFTEIFKRGTCRGFHEIHSLKGDSDRDITIISLDNSNDGDGIYNI